jgi:dolichyl-phosphate-mannose-protein mannosyltransferase
MRFNLRLKENLAKFGDLFFLAVLSFFTRFFNLGFPSKVIWDEVHFGLYATKYFSHQYYFDIHPPLGKMLFALAGWIGKIKPNFSFESGIDYGDFNFLVLRSLTALFGSLLVILIYFFVKELGFSRRVAFISSFFVLFDNAILVQSRLILMDIILIFFIFSTFYLFLLSKRYSSLSFRWKLFRLLSGISLGAAISIKLIGLGALVLILISLFLEEKIFSKTKKEKLLNLLVFIFLPFLLYFLIYALHFYLLPLQCNQNCGFVLDMTINAEKDLLQNGLPFPAYLTNYNVPPSGNILSKFIKNNIVVLANNTSGEPYHYSGSRWFSWPFMMRPVQYFPNNLRDDTNSYIYFLGNPLVWWLGFLGIIGIFYLGIKELFFQSKLKPLKVFYSKNLFFLIISYFVFLYPFAFIRRYTLIYLYLTALIFAIIIFSIFFERVLEIIFGVSSKERLLFSSKKANFIFFALLIIIFLNFLFFSPLTYGFNISKEALQSRMWLKTWIP